VGFEPTIPVKVYTLSKRAPSATRPSLLCSIETEKKYVVVILQDAMIPVHGNPGKVSHFN
jgi:hypothetical protein